MSASYILFHYLIRLVLYGIVRRINMKKNILVSLVSTMSLCALIIQGCGPNDPNDIPTELPADQALGKATDAPPAGATFIDAPAFLLLYQQKQLRLTNEKSQFEDIKLMESSNAAAAQIVAPLAAQDPVMGSPSGLAANPSIIFHGKDGSDHRVFLMGADEKNVRVASAVRKFGSQANQLQLYRHLHRGNAPDNVTRMTSMQVRLMNRAEAQAQMRDVQAGQATGASSAVPSSLATLSCAGDEGAGLGTDHTGDGSGCDVHSPLGLFAGYQWPLKQYVTCVKDQGNRGTCGAFAIVASLETAVAVKYNRRVNLSEQDLYGQVKNWWWPTYYGDGVNPDGVWQKMVEKNYVIPNESVWDYNPSYWRGDDAAKAGYVHSCTNYSGACSDTAHQAALYCTLSNDLLFCGYSSPVNEGNHGFRTTGETEIWDSGDTTSSIHAIGALVAANKTVNIGMDVPPSFDNPDTNGYVHYVAKDGASRGGHLVTVVGYITNATLAQTLPTAPAGAGGGYLIVKNSWGLCWSDGGFVYLPFSWASANVWSASVIDDLVSQ